MSAGLQGRDAAALVQALVAARREHAQLSSVGWADALQTPEDAYAAQDAVAAALGWFGDAAPVHWKSGGPSRDTPLTHAPLPPAGVRMSPPGRPKGETRSAKHEGTPGNPAGYAGWPMHQPAIEAEIALRIGVDVDAARTTGLRPDRVDDLVDAMAVSIEVVDSRWIEGVRAPALLRLADQQSHGALVLGPWLPYTRRDWPAQGCTVRIGAQPPVVRSGGHALGDPAWVLPQWLRHATRHGATVRAGSVVTTGTWVGLLAAQAGDEVVVEFAGIGAASLRL